MFGGLPKKQAKSNKTDGVMRSTKHISQKIRMGSALFKHKQGHFPPEGLRLIANDENPWIDEGLVGCKITRDLASFSSSDTKKNGEHPCHKKFFVGSLAVTDQRIVAYSNTKRQLLVCFEEPRILQISFCVEDKTDLVITFDAISFRCSPNSSPTSRGILEYRFKTVNAEQIHSQIQSRIWAAQSKSCKKSMRRYSCNKQIAFSFHRRPSEDTVHKEQVDEDTEEDSCAAKMPEVTVRSYYSREL